MVITWFGLSCFKITSGALTVVTDPFSKDVGLTPLRVQTDVAVISNVQNPNYNNQASLGGEKLFVVDGPGEFDVRDLFVHGIPTKNSTTMYKIRMEDMRLGFLGSLKAKELTDSELDELGEVDILLIPVGGDPFGSAQGRPEPGRMGDGVCDSEEAVRIVSQIEPHIVVPMHYAQKGLKLKLDPLEKFLKEIGSKPEPQDKLTIKKSELSSFESAVVVLNPQR